MRISDWSSDVCSSDLDYAGRGLGADILSDALRHIAIASQSIGIGAVLVHAKGDQAMRFYMACAEFIEYPADSCILFLPIETVIAAFAIGRALCRERVCKYG